MRARPRDPIIREALASGALLLAAICVILLGIVGPLALFR